MSTAAHTPWHNGAAPGSKYVFIPGNAKPINAGSIERAEHIVRCVNAHDDLVAALRGMVSIHDSVTMGQERERRVEWLPKARAALAKADMK